MAQNHAKNGLPQGFCILPWVNLHIATTGSISPCCEFDGEISNLSDSTLPQAWDSAALTQIREAFTAGTIPEACRKCVDREASEGASLRTQSNGRFSDWLDKIAEADDPMHIAPKAPAAYDLRFSNLCNFKCRSCWHGASSKWYADGKAIGVTMADKAEIVSFASVDDFLGQIGAGLGHVESIYFAGGEPLIMPEHYALLERLVALGRTDVHLSYNTNMSRTAFRDQSIFALWKHFPKLDVTASVDARGARGAFVRSGFDWENFVANVGALRREVPHADIKFGITVSVLNALELTTLIEALIDACDAPYSAFDLHSLQDPPIYRTQILPARLKAQMARDVTAFVGTLNQSDPDFDALSEKLAGIVRYMQADDLSYLQRKFARMSGKLDDLRGEDSAAVMPELADVLGKTGKWRNPLSGWLKALRS
ncbi:MAG: twitch domain-containing radical SAM protein [Pseudomonadota bacterium]